MKDFWQYCKSRGINVNEAKECNCPCHRGGTPFLRLSDPPQGCCHCTHKSSGTEAFMKRIDRLETEMAQVEKELACAQLTITRLDDRIENICQTVVDLDKKFSKLEHFVLKQNEPQCLCKCPMNGIMNLWQELNKLIGKVSAMGQDITGEREDVGGLKKRVDIVEKLYAGLSHEIQQNYEELEAEIDETDRLHSLLADDTDTRLKALESQTSQIFVICSICNGRGSFENKKEMDYENIINGVKFPVGTEYIQLIRCIVCKGKGKNPLKPKEQ